MTIDPQQASTIVVDFLKRKIQQTHSDGICLGLSGGVDSAVLGTLAVRAAGTSAVHSLHLHDRDSNPMSLGLARGLGKQLGIHFEARSITPILKEQGAYASPIVRLAGCSPRLARGVIWTGWCVYRRLAKENPFNLVLRRGEPLKGRLAHILYRALAASVERSFSARHITRRRLLEGYAAVRNLLVVGAANRTEWLTGWFVKDGIDDVPIEPLLGLYKTQVYELACFLEVPVAIIQQAPSPDMLPGLTDEAVLGFRYEKLDAVLHYLEHEGDDVEVLSSDVSPYEIEQIRRLRELSEWKRSTQHESPEFPTPSVSSCVWRNEESVS
jgi:NAD+ synthase